MVYDCQLWNEVTQLSHLDYTSFQRYPRLDGCVHMDSLIPKIPRKHFLIISLPYPPSTHLGFFEESVLANSCLLGLSSELSNMFSLFY